MNKLKELVAQEDAELTQLCTIMAHGGIVTFSDLMTVASEREKHYAHHYQKAFYDYLIDCNGVMFHEDKQWLIANITTPGRVFVTKEMVKFLLNRCDHWILLFVLDNVPMRPNMGEYDAPMRVRNLTVQQLMVLHKKSILTNIVNEMVSISNFMIASNQPRFELVINMPHETTLEILSRFWYYPHAWTQLMSKHMNRISYDYHDYPNILTYWLSQVTPEELDFVGRTREDEAASMFVLVLCLEANMYSIIE